MKVLAPILIALALAGCGHPYDKARRINLSHPYHEAYPYHTGYHSTNP